MSSLKMSCSSSSSMIPSFSLHTKQSNRFLSLKPPTCSNHSGFSKLALASSFISFDPLKFTVAEKNGLMVVKKNRRVAAVNFSAPLTTHTLQWISTIASTVLMISRGTAINKSFLVPLFALQAPAAVISWMKGEYGTWTAFLALLVRLFFSIPGELELPLSALLLVIVAPYHVMKYRGTQESAIVSLVISGYLAFQHFTRMGRLQNAFDEGSLISTTAVICVAAASFLLFI